MRKIVSLGLILGLCINIVGCSNKFSDEEVSTITEQQNSIDTMLIDLCEYSDVVVKVQDYYINKELTKEEYVDMLNTAKSKFEMYSNFYDNIDLNSIIKYNKYLKDYADISQKETDEKVDEINKEYQQGRNILKYYLGFISEVEENDYVLTEQMWARYKIIDSLCDAYLSDNTDKIGQWEEILNERYN